MAIRNVADSHSSLFQLCTEQLLLIVGIRLLSFGVFSFILSCLYFTKLPHIIFFCKLIQVIHGVFVLEYTIDCIHCIIYKILNPMLLQQEDQ